MPTLNTTALDIFIFRRDVSRHALFLLLHQAPQTRYAGTWRILDGTVGAGETPVTAAARAVHEATGLRVVTLWALDYTHTYYDPRTDLLHVTPAIAVEVEDAKTTLAAEYDEARWITPDQAGTLLRWPGHREGLRRLQEDVILSDDRGAPFRVATHG